MSLKFNVLKNDLNNPASRLGILSTAHGEIHTPCFMPVGTAGTVKAMKMEDVKATGAEIILGNTYHLMMRPDFLLLNLIKLQKMVLAFNLI